MRTILTAITAATLLAVAAAYADQQVSAQFKMPVQANLNIEETDCSNNPGPWITLEGEIVLGGLQAELIFQNNVKGTHKATVTVTKEVVLLPMGSSITIPKQPCRGGVGGNPHIWLQFINSAGDALSSEIYLGRCVQGLKISNDLLCEALAGVVVAPDSCDNSPGPTITLNGGLTLDGMKARLIFRNNVKGTHEAEAITEVTLLPEGSQVVLPKQPVLGGVGGNPLIWIQLLLGNGDPIDDPVFLGRCVQM